MQVIARMTLGAAVLGLLFLGGCRSTTDRMRVVEAERADAERRNKELQNELATLRAESVETQSDLERERARADAAEARMTALQSKTQPGTVRVDPKDFDIDGVDVTRNKDGGTTLVLASDVTFKAGRADLSGKALKILTEVAAALKSTDGIGAVRIEGHTDSDPIRRSGWESNEQLSLARAETVKQYLVDHGIDKSLLAVDGLGARRPVVPNDSVKGKAQNRRVEIILVER